MTLNSYEYTLKTDFDKLSDKLSDSLILFSKEFSFYNTNQKHILNSLDRIVYQLQEYTKENRDEFLKLRDEMKNIPLLNNDLCKVQTDVEFLKTQVHDIIMNNKIENTAKEEKKKIIGMVPSVLKIVLFSFFGMYVIIDVMINFAPQINQIISRIHGTL